MRRNTLLLVHILTICAYSVAIVSQDPALINRPNIKDQWEINIDERFETNEKNDPDYKSSWLTEISDKDGSSKMKGFYDNGHPYYEATIVNELLQGQYQIWYENGQLAESLFFNDNLENGLARFYYQNGQLAMKGMYYMGKMVGQWEFYNDRGEAFTGWWKWKFAGPMDKIRMSGYVIDGRPMGTWTYQTTGNQRKDDQKQFEEDIF